MPRIVKQARIACLDMNLQKARMLMGVQVLVSDPAELEKIRRRESDIVKVLSLHLAPHNERISRAGGGGRG